VSRFGWCERPPVFEFAIELVQAIAEVRWLGVEAVACRQHACDVYCGGVRCGMPRSTSKGSAINPKVVARFSARSASDRAYTPDAVVAEAIRRTTQGRLQPIALLLWPAWMTGVNCCAR